MTKLKKPLTLAQLRERWSLGGKTRAKNLTQKRIDEIAVEGGEARKAKAIAAKEAKARELAATQTPEPAAP